MRAVEAAELIPFPTINVVKSINRHPDAISLVKHKGATRLADSMATRNWAASLRSWRGGCTAPGQMKGRASLARPNPTARAVMKSSNEFPSKRHSLAEGAAARLA